MSKINWRRVQQVPLTAGDVMKKRKWERLGLTSLMAMLSFCSLYSGYRLWPSMLSLPFALLFVLFGYAAHYVWFRQVCRFCLKDLPRSASRCSNCTGHILDELEDVPSQKKRSLWS